MKTGFSKFFYLPFIVRLTLRQAQAQGAASCNVETGLKPVSTCRTITTKSPPCEGGELGEVKLVAATLCYVILEL